MPRSRLFGHDPLTGITEWFHPSEDGRSFTIETRQEIEGTLDVNQRLRNDAPGNWRGDMHRVASIPLAVLQELSKRGIITAGGRILDEAAFRRWLNASDNMVFRTRPGRV
jgi:hypothetical protein